MTALGTSIDADRKLSGIQTDRLIVFTRRIAAHHSGVVGDRNVSGAAPLLQVPSPRHLAVFLPLTAGRGATSPRQHIQPGAGGSCRAAGCSHDAAKVTPPTRRTTTPTIFSNSPNQSGLATAGLGGSAGFGCAAEGGAVV
jgi:hypothetical protein